ncbi:MAG: helix-turn-helix domain-containing protein [Saprospiraceae bacterium]|nr:helix-turn-helix domain-containing protein [Saprospiraceae bacterium]
MLKFKFIILLGLICGFVNGQSFDRVFLGDETEFNFVYDIEQDDKSYIWLATEEGVLRFNAHSSRLYNEYDGLPPNFANRISCVFMDSKRRIWACADNKLAYYDELKDGFVQIKVSDDYQFSLIYDISELKDRLILATFTGVWSIAFDDNNKPIKIDHFLEEVAVQHASALDNEVYLGSSTGSYLLRENTTDPVKILEDVFISSACKYNDGVLLGSMSKGLFYRDNSGNSKQVVQINFPVSDIVFDEEGKLFYIATDGDGLYILDQQLKIIKHHLFDANQPKSLTSNGLYDLLIDRQRILWIASYGGGIMKLSVDEELFTTELHIPNSYNCIANSFTRSILQTNEGNIWYGHKEGISIYYPASNTWKHIPYLNRNGSSKNIVMSLFEDGEFIWAGTYGEGTFRISKRNLVSETIKDVFGWKEPLPLDKVYAVLKDRSGNLWLGGIGSPLIKISTEGEIKTIGVGLIREIKEDANGDIWVAGRQGVLKLENDKPRILSAITINNGEFDFSTVNCVVLEEPSVVWIGTNGDGLIRFELRDSTYEVINKGNGFPSDIVQGVVFDGNTKWVSTSNGLVALDYESKGKYKLKIYNQGDGMVSASFNYGSYARLRDGRLAFGSTEGVVIFVPEQIKSDQFKPIFVFEQLNYFTNQESVKVPLLRDGDQQVSLKYNQNDITLVFSGVDHKSPNKIRYSWRIEGDSRQWSTPQTENEINLVNLNPGTYKFMVKAIGRNDVESDVKSITIVISPPWWKSNLAYFIYALVLAASIVGAYLIARTFLRQKNASEQISFFNNITHELKTPLTILLTKLSNESDQQSATGEIRSTVNRLNGLFDQLLNFNKVNSDYYQNQKISEINLKEQLELILGSFREMIARKEVSVVVDNNWPEPNFYYKKDSFDKIIFNLFSNALKYSKNGGKIDLQLRRESDGSLKIVVTDNGIGIPKEQQKDILKRYFRARNAVNSQLPGTGLGLMIVKSLLDNDHGKIAFVSEEGMGTTFTVIMRNFRKDFKPEATKKEVIVQDEPVSPEAGHKPRILVVEDNDELRIDMVEKLSEHFSIMAARNGKEGFDKAKAKLPDLIVTDFIMPEMDGNALCRALQADEDTNHIPVFMMTVLNNSGQKVESIKSGITSYMTKPVDIPYLVAQIQSTLEYKQKLREKYLHEAEVQKAGMFKDERDAEFMQDLEDFVIERIKEEEISVQDLCKHVGMSRTALYMKLKDTIDQSPQNFIIMTKMSHARKLLLQGGMTVKEVAYEVGFSNPKYFATSFRKQFNMSPSTFLKSLNPE